MSGLPKGWAFTTIGEVADSGQYGWTTKAAESGAIRFLRTTDITKGAINWNKVPYCSEAPADCAKYQLEKNDVVISRAGSVGFSKILDDIPEPTVFASYLIRFKPSFAIEPKFFAAYLNSDAYWKGIGAASVGIALANVNAKNLAGLQIPLAPLPEQKRIADKLDVTLARVDACRERLTLVALILKRFRQSVLAAATSGQLTADWREQQVYSHAGNDDEELQGNTHASQLNQTSSNNANPLANAANFSEKLGNQQPSSSKSILCEEFGWEIPQEWLLKTIDDIAEVKGGKRLPKGEELTTEVTDFPYIRAGQLKEGTVVSDGQLYLTPEVQKQISRYTVEKGDVFITIVGACIGDAGVIPEQYHGANLTENAAKICQFKIPISSEYLACWLRSQPLQDLILGEIKSGAQGKLALMRIKQLPVPYPSFGEQTEIVRRVDTLFAFADRLEARLASATAAAERLTPSLLAKAFRGELVPQDPDDEPASELLKRLAAQREAAGSKPKRGRKASS